MMNIKKSTKIIILFILLATPFCGISQKKLLSEYLSSSHTKAFYDSMSSVVDTLVIDNINEPWVFEPITLKGLKNKVILFEFGVEILAKKKAFPKKTDALWKFIDCENIVIVGNESTMKMNKEEYLDGEWRHVIRLRGCKNISISNLILRDSGGDGIAIGRSNKFWYSKNISLKNIQCINNKRQGISITSAEDVWINDSCFSDTKGTLPGAGVDIEPNVPEERIVNINFKNCIFKNNYNAGIFLSLGELTSNSKKVSIKFKNCRISNNFSIENKAIPAEIVIKSNKTNPVLGTVLFDKCIIENSDWSMLYSRNNVNGFYTSFKDCMATNICNRGMSMAAIYFEVPHYSKKADFGGYSFENLKLNYIDSCPPLKVKGSRFAIYNNFKNVKGKISITNPNIQQEFYVIYQDYNPIFNENIELEIVRN